MSRISDDPDMGPVDRWDRVTRQLSAQPRRIIIGSLMDVPPERRLPLPEAALDSSIDRPLNEYEIQLEHHHLPMLANAGYVRWTHDPFCVQQGPNFEEVAAVLGILIEGVDELPGTLVHGCDLLEERN